MRLFTGLIGLGLALGFSAGIAAEFIPGDLNDDGSFDMTDSVVLRRALVGLGPGIAQEVLCGNGLLDPNEDCDLGGLACQTCVDVGFSFGTLSCGEGCTFDTSGCTDARFVDNGDGTISDHQTGLMWEKKTNDGSIHDVDDFYATFGGQTVPTTFLSTLNGGVTGDGNCKSSDGTTITGGFVGFCDWRLPTITELQTILDCGFGPPCIDDIFGPTGSSYYWSATAFDPDPGFAWFVNFSNGAVSSLSLFDNVIRVRAVRGGPCAGTACVGTQVQCPGPGGGCTELVCDESTTSSACDLLVTVPAGNSCNDGDLCTAGDICADAICVAGSPIAVDDGNPCTSDSCVGGVVMNDPLPDGSSCGLGFICDSGECVAVECPCWDSSLTTPPSRGSNAAVLILDPDRTLTCRFGTTFSWIQVIGVTGSLEERRIFRIQRKCDVLSVINPVYSYEITGLTTPQLDACERNQRGATAGLCDIGSGF